MTTLVLASASPRRRALFGLLGYPFETCAVDIDESPRPGEEARDMVLRLAMAKAAEARAARPDAVVVAADTVVDLDGAVLGKPDDADDAARMLAALSGREHRVWTAVAVWGPGEAKAVEWVVTRVRFRPLTPERIAAYVATGEPMDKAGAYGIQERGAVLVERIDGDHFTVVGLPLARLAQMLETAVGPPPA